MNRADVIVVGGGMVGATVTALAGRAGLSVHLVDARGAPRWSADDTVGLRVSAISPGSAAILRQAGAWREVENRRHCPYRRMHVEDGQGAGVLDFEAGVFGLERLGTIVENDLLGQVLWQALGSLTTVRRHAPARLGSIAQDDDGVHCVLEDGTELHGRLLVGCDGPGSRVRRAAGISAQAWEYNQKALVGVIRHANSNPGVAWQRFLPGGPLALLPLADGASSMVWTLPAAEADALLAVDDTVFREQLDTASDGWPGAVTASGPRGAFPLSMSLGDRFVAGRVVLLGDAAHVVHPLAGQGVNLGLADAAALLEVVLQQRASGGDLGDARALRAFERWRRSESALMAGGVHALGALFRATPLSLPRGLGMRLLNRGWFLREAFARRAAGLGPHAPRLARGERLPGLSPAD